MLLQFYDQFISLLVPPASKLHTIQNVEFSLILFACLLHISILPMETQQQSGRERMQRERQKRGGKSDAQL